MDFALVYIAHRLVYRIFDFFHHWYVDGSRLFLARFLTVFGGLEQSFAIRATLAHFFEPLYKDYSAIGRMLGVPFRAGRILLAGAFYILFIVGFIAAYVLWIALPLALLVLASRNVPPTDLVRATIHAADGMFSWFIASFLSFARPGR